MTEKEFLKAFKAYEIRTMFNECVGNNKEITFNDTERVINSFLEEHHKEYYEVEFEPKTEVQLYAPSILMSMPIVLDESLPDNIIELRNKGILVDRIKIDIEK